ncbi:hypothetical protein [Mycolicibacterium sp. P1-18]|uniref:hypothetical protein n=1 Tax=Mycolicibacterium sp. P1-18 TaxID=2024615 RepID=UPI0011F1B68D|nr:hypothetical protein [Mycolicibacterium sp. P1-18]
MTDDSADDAETVFEMDPERTLVMLARQLVDGQRSLADLRRQTQVVAEGADPAQARTIRDDFAVLEQQWHRETLPSMVASFQLALEVLDTFGPGRARVDDPMDARIWNNKFFVWYTELGGTPPAE